MLVKDESYLEDDDPNHRCRFEYRADSMPFASTEAQAKRQSRRVLWSVCARAPVVGWVVAEKDARTGTVQGWPGCGARPAVDWVVARRGRSPLGEAGPEGRKPGL